MARVPGPLGSGSRGGQSVLHRGPLDGTLVAKAGDTPAVTPGPLGINDQAAKAIGKPAAKAVPKSTEAKAVPKSTETTNAEKELDLLRRLYGTMKNSSNTKTYFSWKREDKKDKKSEMICVYNTDEYIKDRKSFFGSTKDYEDYRKKAKEDLDADSEKLRKYVDPPQAVRNKHKDWKDGQDVFYSWVKKAFEKNKGTKTEYSKVIKAQMSDKLKKALATVKVDYGKSFKVGGFNPRPQKRPGGVYLLGTISKHAVGDAIDIDATKNAQIESKKWGYILAYTGKKAGSSDLKAKWESKDVKKAKEVYDTIKGVNDEWVSKLDKAVNKLEEDAKKKAKKAAEIEKAAEAKAATAKAGDAPGKANSKSTAANPAPKVDYLGAVIDDDENLKKIGKGWVKEWKGGFLSLEWKLVKELHEEGFKWGATFGTPDLHHFEL